MDLMHSLWLVAPEELLSVVDEYFELSFTVAHHA